MVAVRERAKQARWAGLLRARRIGEKGDGLRGCARCALREGRRGGLAQMGSMVLFFCFFFLFYFSETFVTFDL